MNEIEIPKSMDETKNPKKGNKKKKIMFLFVCLLIISIIGNILLLVKLNSPEISGMTFKLIKPSSKQPIDSNIQSRNSILQYESLKPLLEEEINQYNATGKIGLFVQDDGTGAWLGINEKEGYSPASLLKVPIMMAILKKIERGEMKLTDKITLTEDDVDAYYGDLYKRVGEPILVTELLEQMITYSDNTAKNALKRQLSILDLDTVFIHIGIPDPYLTGNNQTVSPRNYIRLFKALYYSTYLTPSLSEFGLELTTDTQEENLISKGVPPEVQVAHKFGIINDEILSDCGIIYHEKNPYFLCIMTKGLSLEKSKELIQRLSTDVYNFVDSSS